MNEQERWQENNARYLSTALTWLRLRLERLAQSLPEGQAHITPPATPLAAPASVAAPAPATKRGFLSRYSSQPAPALLPASTPTPAPAPVPVSAQKSEPVTDEQVKQQADALADLAQQSNGETPPALILLSRRFGLSDFERDTLLLCIAMELDPRIADLCARAQDNPNWPYPTFALALALFDEPSWDILSPQRPLRYWRLIEIHQPGAQLLTTSALSADERIVNYVKGLNYLDDRLASLVAPLEVDADQITLPPSQQAVVQAILRTWHHAIKADNPLPVIQLTGPDAPSKHLVAAHAVAQMGQHLLYRIPLEMLPTQPAELETLARLWQRESLLLPLAFYLDGQEIDGGAPDEARGGLIAALNRFLVHSEGLFFLGVRETWPRLSRGHLALDVDKPTPSEQKGAWAEALQGAEAEITDLLASQFNLNLNVIHRTARAELDEDAGEQTTLAERLWLACRLNSRPRMDNLAQRLDTKATWNDLVLPDDQLRLLHQIADQVGLRHKVYESWGFAERMNRGLGISVLFAGPPGSGKTMTAEVIANALRLNLYRIDLSAVVNKYIGETEKNLRRLFDAAEDGGAILFFDEADALFGKRSEVKESLDRFANIEIDYLLQRMEAYRGLAILATNMKSALDTAFLRRLRFVVNFPFPGPAERKRIWQQVFPREVPKQALDYDWLARLNLSGGSIHNIALNAAFLAAHEDPKAGVTMQQILTAARDEFTKLERPINEADFRWQAPAAQEVKA
jgi:ATPase family associated with various cellular activities (AAA)